MKKLLIAMALSTSLSAMDEKCPSSCIEIDTAMAFRTPTIELPQQPETPSIFFIVDEQMVRRLSGANQSDPIQRTAAPAPPTPARDRAHTPPGIASTNRAKIYIALITGGAAIVSAVITYLIARSEC